MTQPALLHPPPDSNEPAVGRDPRPSRTAPATCSLGSCQYAWLLQVRDIPCPVPGLSVVGCGCWGPCGSIWLETFCFQWGAPVWPRPNLRAALQAGGVQVPSPLPAADQVGGRTAAHPPSRKMHVLRRGPVEDLRSRNGPRGGDSKSSPLFFTSLPPHKQLLWLLVSQLHALLLAQPPASQARQPFGDPRPYFTG